MTYPTALKKIWGRPRHKQTHTHTQYTLFDECIAPGPNVVSPLAGRTGWPQRHSRHVTTPLPPGPGTPAPLPPSPPSPPQFPQISQLAQAARAWRRPVSPSSGEGTQYTGATARA